MKIMNKNVLMIIPMLLVFVGNIYGQDKIYIADFEIMPGETKTVDILLDNPNAEYRDLQFDFYLPDGISVVQDDDEEFLVDMGSRCTRKHTVGFSYRDGHYVCMLYSTAKNPLTGNSGDILSVTLKAAENISSGMKTGYFRNVSLSKTDATGPTYAEFSFGVTVKSVGQSVTVKAENKTMVYGDNVPALTYEVKGAELDGTPTLTTIATKTSAVGTYPITITTGTVTNMLATYVDGTLTITKAPLTVKAQNYTIKQGENLPVFAASYIGFKNGETESVLTKQPVFTCAATSESVPGTYDIIVDGAEAQNYELSFVKGVLTIEPKSDEPVIEEDNCINGIYYIFDEETHTAEVTHGKNEYTGNIVIPESVEYKGHKYAVTIIGSAAFSGCGEVTSVTIPEGVTSIQWTAFDGTSLTSVTIPKSVTSIGAYAFSGTGLTSVIIPESVTSIGEGAFGGCQNLTSVQVESGNPIYDSRENCNAIIETASNTLVEGWEFSSIPNSVTSIGNGAFVYCYDLTSINIPSSVTSIGSSAFWGCGLTTVTIPESIKSIGTYAFYCSSLTDVYCCAESVPETGDDVFFDVDLENVTLHVPAVSFEAYKAIEPWKSFGRKVLLEEDNTAINGLVSVPAVSLQIFTPDGKRVNTLQKGLNIIHKGNVVEKVYVK